MSSVATAAKRSGVGGFGGWLSMAPQTDDVHVPPQPVAVVNRPRADSTHASSPSQPASPVYSPALARPQRHVDHGGLQPQPLQSQPLPHTSTDASATALRVTPPPTAVVSGSALKDAGALEDSSSDLGEQDVQAPAPAVPLVQQKHQEAATNMSSRHQRPQAPSHTNNFGRIGGGPSAIPRRILPRTNARFSVGGDSSASMLASPASPAPTSPSYSQKSGDGDESPPPFDVRTSFAPMRWGNAPDALPGSRRASQAGSSDDLPQSSANAADETRERNRLLKRSSAERQQNDDEDQGVHSDGERVEVAGRKWKGKTANAIELEMEALGDRTVMSYAPDAVYLASRLEGLRRNLEAGGERFRRWAWEDIEEEEGKAGTDEDHKPLSSPLVADEDSQGQEMRDTEMEVATTPLDKVTDATAPSSIPTIVSSAPLATISGQSSPLRLTHRASRILSPVHEVPQDPLQSGPVVAEATEQEDPLAAPPSDSLDTVAINRTAKEAALDSRVEIRTLRRPDLEQVRELHCYHGDGDKVDTETYTTSAAFLLRLLVDEHYVCLVAVAKPLPEPPSLPTRFTPRPPPPSLDMPASKSPFLLAGRTMMGVTQRAAQDTTAQRRTTLVPPTGVVPATHAEALLHEAPAPRSFGAGPDSENASSSNNDPSDEDERMRQESLFEAAKAASTHVTGNTSLPQSIDEEDENMSDIVNTDPAPNGDYHETAVSETDGSAVVPSPRTQMQGTFAAATSSPRHAASTARRTSSSTTVHRSGKVVLAGPTFDVAPPRAIRVMGAPPMSGMPTESETILGVASARIKVVQRAADDFGSGSSGGGGGWTLGGPMPAATSKDSSWPGMDSRGERSVVTREAHIMTLSVLPGERGQGLGARLLDLLLEECKRRTAGPRIHLAAGSMTTDEANSTADGGTTMATAPPRAHENAPMRTVLEMHPSNASAMQLYTSRNFRQMAGSKGVVRHFFRGDQRIPNNVRVKVGGSDAIRMERIDVP